MSEDAREDEGEDAFRARIEQAISRLGADHEPPLGWQARVLAEVAGSGRGRTQWWSRWWRAILPASVSAAVAFALLVWVASPTKTTVALSIRRVSERQVLRGGEDFFFGDRLGVEADCGAARCAIRAYRDDRPLLACPGSRGCRVAGEISGVELDLDRLGEYLVIAFPAAALPIVEESDGTLDGDLSRLRAANVVVRQWSLLVR